MSRVPGHVVEGVGQPFPKGVFLGRLTEVKDAWSEDNKNLEYNLTFKDNTPVEGPNVGARPFMPRLTIIFGGQSVVDIAEFTETTPFALVRSAGLISQLALALGYPVRINSDKSVDFDMEEFLENLSAGAYRDKTIGYEVRHRPWSSKDKGPDGKPLRTGISAEPFRFFNPNGQIPQTTVAPPVATEAAVASSEVSAPAIGPATVTMAELRTRQ